MRGRRRPARAAGHRDAPRVSPRSRRRARSSAPSAWTSAVWLEWIARQLKTTPCLQVNAHRMADGTPEFTTLDYRTQLMPSELMGTMRSLPGSIASEEGVQDEPRHSPEELSALADEGKAYRKPDGKVVCATRDRECLLNAIAEWKLDSHRPKPKRSRNTSSSEHACSIRMGCCPKAGMTRLRGAVLRSGSQGAEAASRRGRGFGTAPGSAAKRRRYEPVAVNDAAYVSGSD